MMMQTMMMMMVVMMMMMMMMMMVVVVMIMSDEQLFKSPMVLVNEALQLREAVALMKTQGDTTRRRHRRGGERNLISLGRHTPLVGHNPNLSWMLTMPFYWVVGKDGNKKKGVVHQDLH